jgi:hypothetical protein
MEIQGMLDVGDDATPPPSLLEDDTLELGAAVLLMQAPYVERAPLHPVCTCGDYSAPCRRVGHRNRPVTR